MTDHHKKHGNEEKHQNITDKEIEQELEDQPAPAEEKSPDNSKKIEELEVLIAELKDQSIRALAEAENTRRRAEKDVIEARKYAVSGITKDFIDVLENLFRATEYLTEEQKSNEAIKKVAEGIELTKNSFIKTLEKYGVKRVSPDVGEPFDHNFHQAISQLPSNEYKPGQIVQVVQAGYVVGDRLLRPAMVIISQ